MSRHRRSLRRLTGALTSLALAGFGALMIANSVVFSAAKSKSVQPNQVLIKRQAAIVLGAGVSPDGSPSPVLEARLEAARALYEQGSVERVLVSGDHAKKGYNEVAVMFTWLLEHGVEDKDLFVDHAGLRTLDSMYRARHLFGIEEAYVCTQRFHLDRAIFLGEAYGIDTIGVSAEFPGQAPLHFKANARELVARAVAVADVYLLGRRARHHGEPIPIETAPASASWDEQIKAIAAAHRSR